jgi:hypothetical protein
MGKKKKKNASTRTGKALAVNASHQRELTVYQQQQQQAERRERAAVFYVLLYLQQQPQKAGGFVNRDLQDDAPK